MENATKALLIVAGILIVIVIISLSILLLKNTNSTGDELDKVGGEILGSTEKQSDKLWASLNNAKFVTKERKWWTNLYR